MGYYLNFGEGEYSAGDGIFTMAYNDYFRAIKVFKGCSATLYEDIDYNAHAADAMEYTIDATDADVE